MCVQTMCSKTLHMMEVNNTYTFNRMLKRRFHYSFQSTLGLLILKYYEQKQVMCQKQEFT